MGETRRMHPVFRASVDLVQFRENRLEDGVVEIFARGRRPAPVESREVECDFRIVTIPIRIGRPVGQPLRGHHRKDFCVRRFAKPSVEIRDGFLHGLQLVSTKLRDNLGEVPRPRRVSARRDKARTGKGRFGKIPQKRNGNGKPGAHRSEAGWHWLVSGPIRPFDFLQRRLILRHGDLSSAVLPVCVVNALAPRPCGRRHAEEEFPVGALALVPVRQKVDPENRIRIAAGWKRLVPHGNRIGALLSVQKEVAVSRCLIARRTGLREPFVPAHREKR